MRSPAYLKWQRFRLHDSGKTLQDKEYAALVDMKVLLPRQKAAEQLLTQHPPPAQIGPLPMDPASKISFTTPHQVVSNPKKRRMDGQNPFRTP